MKFYFPLLYSSKIVLKAVLSNKLNFLPITKIMQSTNALHPIIPNNACSLRITAAAGTKLAGAYSLTNVIIIINKRTLQPITLKQSLLLSSFTQYYWIMLLHIVQNSPLLAKAWALSQSQCG